MDYKLKKYKFVNHVHTPAVTARNSFLYQSGSGDQKLTENDIATIYGSIILKNITDSMDLESKKLVNGTYGEMKFEGVERMIAEANIGPADVFFDLGSGNGKAAMQVFVNAGVKEAFGVEFYPERFRNAEAALKRLYILKPDLLNDDRLLSYQLQNIKDVYYLNDATIIYMCSTCYPDDLLEYVYNKIKSNSNLRCIITHKKYDKFLEFLPILKTAILPCTWTPSPIWHFYTKN